MRRFWQPVAISSELKDVPLAVRLLGEELFLFRTGDGRVGLLDSHCSHRGTSLEFGRLEQSGLRCCCHGWLYDMDGTILETPGEANPKMLCGRIFHGAYPLH